MTTENNNTSMASATVEAFEAEGFHEKGHRGGGTLYLNVFDYSICMKSKEPVDAPGWSEEPIKTVNPTTKEEKLTWVKRFDPVIARIIRVKREKKSFDSGNTIVQWTLTLLAGGKYASLQCVTMDSFLKRFLMIAPNLDFSKPVAISAWMGNNKGKPAQKFSIRQPGPDAGADHMEWESVPYFWKPEYDDLGHIIPGSPNRSETGDLLPPWEQDEDDGKWSSKKQDRHLIAYFDEHVAPKIEQMYSHLGQGSSTDTTKSSDSGFSGPPTEEVAVVTTLPQYPAAQTLEDAMTPQQAFEARELLQRLNMDPEQASQALLKTSFILLSKQGASYLIYRAKEKLEKSTQTAPANVTSPAVSAPAPQAQAPAPAQQAPVDPDTNWGTPMNNDLDEIPF